MNKFITLFLICILGISITTYADKKTPEMKAKKNTIKLAQSLKLSKEQQSKIYQYYLSSYKAYNDLDLQKIDKATRDAKKDEIKNNRTLQINKVLTPAQVNQLQKDKLNKKSKSKKSDNDD